MSTADGAPRHISIEMPGAGQCNMPSIGRHQNHPHIHHDEETDMTGSRVLILIAALVITGCEALVFIGTTYVN
jgi:hypothetical protein